MTVVLVSKCTGINSSIFMMCKNWFIYFFVLFLILGYFLGNYFLSLKDKDFIFSLIKPQFHYHIEKHEK